MNVHFAVQLLVSTLSLMSVWIGGDRSSSRWWTAWPILIAAHLIFLAYSAWTRQFGFWELNVGMITIGVRNWRRTVVHANT